MLGQVLSEEDVLDVGDVLFLDLRSPVSYLDFD
jgi:hypothetical protein